MSRVDPFTGWRVPLAVDARGRVTVEYYDEDGDCVVEHTLIEIVGFGVALDAIDEAEDDDV